MLWVLIRIASSSDTHSAYLFFWARSNFCDRLRSEGIELDKSDFDGRTPLHNAAKNGEVLIVAFLLKTTRVNLEARDRYG